MKRFASVFKKSKKQQAGSTTSTTPGTKDEPPAAAARPTPPVPALAGGHGAQSSASSSTVSADLRTPNEDDGAGHRFPSPTPRQKKAWISSWVGGRKSTSRTDLSNTLDHQQQQNQQRQHHPSSSSTTLLAPPVPHHPLTTSVSAPQTPTRRMFSTPTPVAQTKDESDDDSSSDEDEDESEAQPATPRPMRLTSRPSPLVSPASPAASSQAVANVRQLTMQSLVPPFSPPPLLHLPGKALFPRSANSTSLLVKQESLRSRNFRARMLRRLETKPLASADAQLLAPFANRVISEKHKRSSFVLDENAVRGDYTKRIGSSSTGLKRWATRPPFEGRFAVWTSDGNVVISAVVAIARPGFAVAALEISTEVELLAGLHGESAVDDGSGSPSRSSSHMSAESPSASNPQQTHRPTPSPLRMEQGQRPASTPELVSMATSTPSTRNKPGVRFSAPAEEDPADLVPLGYAHRQQQQKAEKAKFLQEQQAKRVSTAHADEARRMAAERAQWEQERAQWAAERKAEEDARKQRQLAEQFTAARERQAQGRGGYVPASPTGSVKATPVQEKPTARRQWSDPSTVSVRNSSPSSSRPPSVNGSATPAYPTPASSVEDVRTRNRTSIGVSSPSSSSASERGRRSRRASTHGSTHPQSHVMPPPLPLDAPLLPPAAPFMSEYGSSRRHTNSGSNRGSVSGNSSPAQSSSSASSSASANGSRVHVKGAPMLKSHSTDRVNRQSQTIAQSQTQYTSGSSSSARPSMHGRQSSSGSVRSKSSRPMSMAMPMPPMVYPVSPGAATPPAGYWMVPMPMAGYPIQMQMVPGMQMQMPPTQMLPMQMQPMQQQMLPPMPMQMPASGSGSMNANKRQSVIF